MFVNIMKSRKKLLIYFILCFLMIGCNELSEFEKELTNDSNVWNFMALENDEWKFIGSQRKFLKNNTYMFYISRNSKKKGNNIGVIHLDKNLTKNQYKWHFNEEDSILSFDSKELTYKLIKYNQDTIFLEGNGYTGKFLMIRMDNASDLVL